MRKLLHPFQISGPGIRRSACAHGQLAKHFEAEDAPKRVVAKPRPFAVNTVQVQLFQRGKVRKMSEPCWSDTPGCLNIQCPKFWQGLQPGQQFIGHHLASFDRGHAPRPINGGENSMGVKWLDPVGQSLPRSLLRGLNRRQKNISLADVAVDAPISRKIDDPHQGVLQRLIVEPDRHQFVQVQPGGGKNFGIQPQRDACLATNVFECRARLDRISPFNETRRSSAMVISGGLPSAPAPRHEIAAAPNNAPGGITQRRVHNSDRNRRCLGYWAIVVIHEGSNRSVSRPIIADTVTLSYATVGRATWIPSQDQHRGGGPLPTAWAKRRLPCQRQRSPPRACGRFLTRAPQPL